jgi:hypothetical protein
VVEDTTPVRVVILPQAYDVTAARTAILRDNRQVAWINLGGASACFAIFVGGALAFAGGSEPRLTTALALFSVFLLFGGFLLFGAWSLQRSAPTKVTIDSSGLSFEYPSGRHRRVSWKGRPRPFESEPVVGDIWVRRGPTQSRKTAAAPATIAFCPPYPRKTQFVSTTGLTAEAMAGILRAAREIGLRVTEERTDALRVPGFASNSLPGTVHYVIHPSGSSSVLAGTP